MRHVACALLIALCLSGQPVGAAQEPDRPTTQEPRAERLEDLLRALRSEDERARLVQRLQSLLEVRALDDLVRTLQDDARRTAFERQIEALLVAAPAAEAPSADERQELGSGLAALFAQVSERASSTLVRLVQQVGRLPERVATLAAKLRDPVPRDALLRDAAFLLATLVAAAIGALLAWLPLRATRARLSIDPGVGVERSPLWRLGRLVLRFCVDLAPPAALAAAAWIAMALLAMSFPARSIATAVVLAVVLQRCLVAGLEACLAVGAPRLRLLPVSEAGAQALGASLGRLSALAIYGWSALVALSGAGGGPELLDPLRDLYALVLLIAGLAFVLRERRQLPRQLRPADAPGAGLPNGWRDRLRSMAQLWWVAAIGYMVGLYLLFVSGIEAAVTSALVASLLTVLVAGIAALLQSIVRRLGAKLGGWACDLAGPIDGLAPRVQRYVRLLQKLASVLVWLLAVGFVLEAWGVGAMAALSSGFASRLLSRAAVCLLVVLLALGVVDVVTVLAERYLDRRARLGLASGKLRTLLPLTTKATRLVVSVLAAITVLSQLGVDIAPLLAGVGVIGLAVGFGAQTLVKDVITGAFILIEDSMSVGDIVQVAGVGGQVEAVNVRTVRLRDLSGNVHLIPFSQVGTVTNLTKDFSCYLIECGVAYREDVDEVIRVLEQLGAELRADPGYAADILEPLEVIGVDRFEDSAVIVRVRFKTRPLQQWRVGREFNRRLKRRFDELGIEIPFPHVTVYMGTDKAGNAPPLRVRRAAPPEAEHTSLE